MDFGGDGTPPIPHDALSDLRLFPKTNRYSLGVCHKVSLIPPRPRKSVTGRVVEPNIGIDRHETVQGGVMGRNFGPDTFPFGPSSLVLRLSWSISMRETSTSGSAATSGEEALVADFMSVPLSATGLSGEIESTDSIPVAAVVVIVVSPAESGWASTTINSSAGMPVSLPSINAKLPSSEK